MCKKIYSTEWIWRDFLCPYGKRAGLLHHNIRVRTPSGFANIIF